MADAKVTFETELDTSGLKSGIDALEGVGAGSLIGAIGGKSVLAKIGSTIGNLIGSSMVAAFAKAVGETGMEFNAQFALVSAAVGYQSEQLRALAIEAGDTTQYTAAEAAEAMREMALAGWSEERIMSSFYDVLNLATVGSMDFAAAAEAIGNSMNAFGLETGETTRLIDELSTADVNASTSVAELTRGFLTLGATGRNLAGGTTEAATAMALLSDNGIKGAQAGTQLRNIIVALASPTNKAADALEAMGVSAFNSDGEFRPLIDTFGDLNAALAGMSQQEQLDALNTVFNKQDLKSVNALLGTSVNRWTDLGAQITNSQGATKKMVELMTDTAQHDLKELESAQDTFKLKTYDTFEGVHRWWLQFQTAATRGLTGFVFGADGEPTIDPLALSQVDYSMQAAELLDSSGLQEAFDAQREKMLEDAQNAPTLFDILFPTASAEEMPELDANATALVDKWTESAKAAFLTASPDVQAAMLSAFGDADLKAGAETATAGDGAADPLEQLAVSIADSLAGSVLLHFDLVGASVGSGLEKAAAGADVSMFGNVGLEIARGIAEGIKNGSGAVSSAVQSVINSALAAAKETAGIASPSRLFRDEVGAHIASGAALGVKSNAWRLAEAVGSMVNAAAEINTSNLFSHIGRPTASDFRMYSVPAAAAPEITVPQTVNFNVPVQTPDEFAKTMYLYATYGLQGG